ncbi:MAG: hypothetical protein HY301_04380 [Verrucomicrobia bacterium]|nr:hypothetical protein [Verrucomicrobiota bacterium]
MSGHNPAPKPPADWLAWSLQLAVGLLAGFGVGFIIARVLKSFQLIGFGQRPWVVLGVSLPVGAFASFYGNRGWMIPGTFAPRDFPQTQETRNASKVIGLIGVGLILQPVILHLSEFGWSREKSSSVESKIMLLLGAALFGGLLIHAWRTGTGFWMLGVVRREDTRSCSGCSCCSTRSPWFASSPPFSDDPRPRPALAESIMNATDVFITILAALVYSGPFFPLLTTLIFKRASALHFRRNIWALVIFTSLQALCFLPCFLADRANQPEAFTLLAIPCFTGAVMFLGTSVYSVYECLHLRSLRNSNCEDSGKS